MDERNNLLQAYLEIPLVTRCYITAVVLTTVGLQLGFITPFQLYFNPYLIFYHYHFHRLITSFLYFGYFSFPFIFNISFTYRYCLVLEEGSFRGRTSDFFYMFLFGATCMIILALFVNLIFLGQALTFMLVYVWSKRNPQARVTFFGLVSFYAPLFPWVLFGFSVLVGNGPLVDLMGICVGHAYYFAEDVLPAINGWRPLKTPSFIKYLFGLLEREEHEQRNERFQWQRAE